MAVPYSGAKNHGIPVFNMKLAVFIMLLLGQGEVLIEQHGAQVPVGDVDSYIHDLPSEVRKRISYDKHQLEKDILGMLNMNIVYQYLKDSELIDDPHFKETTEALLKEQLEVDSEFLDKMNIESDTFKESYRQYLTKKALYKALKEYILVDIDQNKAVKLAHDRYKIDRGSYVKPEQRDIGMIQLPQENYSQEQVLSIVKDLMANDSKSSFSDKAKELSEDSTVSLNAGQLGLFKQSGFRYPFADQVFQSQVGLVPAVFEKDQNWYIVRVNEIISSQPIPFEEVKDEMVNEIMTKSMQRRFQRVIDEYAQYKVEVNNEIVDDIFSRYEVFQ